MASLYDLSTLRSGTEIRLRLRLASPLHIRQSEKSRTILVSDAGVPIIPGSTIKGTLRHWSEKLLHLVSSRESCMLVRGNNCGQTILRQMSPDADFDEEIYPRVCPVCRTFGTIGLASRIHVPFVDLEGGEIRKGYGMKIDLKRGTQDVNYPYQYVEPGVEFDLTMHADNLSSENEAVLAAGLLPLIQGMWKFGGMQSRGFGRVELLEGAVRHAAFGQLSEYLDYHDGRSAQSETDVVSFIRDRLGAVHHAAP